jgi:HipA-like C-terminal domain
MNQYPIFSVELSERLEQEPLGSKEKFWVERTDGLWLFKFARPGTGEDWAEKLAAEYAHVLKIEAPRIELAAYDGKRGCLCKSFIDEKQGEALIHGNEVLSGNIAGYDSTKLYSQSSHTVANILHAVQGVFSEPQEFETASQTLATYLVLDALIGNTDRHHENWGLKRTPRGTLVAPSFDHASSLGRENSTERCQQILDGRNLDGYLKRGRGGIYLKESDKHGASPLNLVVSVAKHYPDYFKGWRSKLEQLSDEHVRDLTYRIPENLASSVAKNFAISMVITARNTLMQELV